MSIPRNIIKKYKFTRGDLAGLHIPFLSNEELPFIDAGIPSISMSNVYPGVKVFLPWVVTHIYDESHIIYNKNVASVGRDIGNGWIIQTRDGDDILRVDFYGLVVGETTCLFGGDSYKTTYTYKYYVLTAMSPEYTLGANEG
jgi:hypothetical protein